MGYDYTIILEEPIETARPKLGRLFDQFDRIVRSQELDGRCGLAASNVLEPRLERVDVEFVGEFRRQNPAVKNLFKRKGWSALTVKFTACDRCPLSAGLLHSLAKQTKIAFAARSNKVVSFKQMVDEFGDAIELMREMRKLKDRDLDALEELDLRAIFKSREKVVRPKIERCVEDLLLSDVDHDWELANEKLGDEGASISEVISFFIDLYGRENDAEIRRSVLNGLYLMLKMGEAGLAPEDSDIKTQPFCLKRDEAKTDYAENARDRLNAFFDELVAASLVPSERSLVEAARKFRQEVRAC